jgi:hypothetical protein
MIVRPAAGGRDAEPDSRPCEPTAPPSRPAPSAGTTDGPRAPAAETKVLPDPDLGRCGSTSSGATLQKTP